MSTAPVQPNVGEAGAAAALPVRKRKMEDEDAVGVTAEKAAKLEQPAVAQATDEVKPAAQEDPKTKRGREIRLEQNRKAARESRRRKKVMIEELQRSVIFFSRANGTLKQQNDDLTRLMMQAQMQIAAIESHKESAASAPAAAAVPTPAPAKPEEAAKPAAAEAQKMEDNQQKAEQAQANAVATQAVYETKGYPAAAARAAAQAMTGTMESCTTGESPEKAATAAQAGPLTNQPPLPPMQPGATMQAMANFQQAAAAAMQMAMGQMQNVPGVNMSQLAAAPAGTNAQQAYTDTMTALAMQQAAAAAAAGMMQPVSIA
uniref:BZIP domain-containing protein n=1 Tax=Entomoneis paludosa TaxID=265537 RepID=A0A7S3DWI4_9STRA|mmetsp:Transcript_6893/g.14384  ORF Transcript_6893/g.14384 Transcript_6893/m.14384 type:complete len:317 (+) Transcript_6893:181-1131(+)